MRKRKSHLSVFLLIVFVLSVFTFGSGTANAVIEPGITVPSFSQLKENQSIPIHSNFWTGHVLRLERTGLNFAMK